MTMRHAIPGLVLFAAACGTSAPTGPAKPAAPTTTLSGSVSASNDGAPLAGLTVTSAGVSAVTSGNGAFGLNVQANVFRQVDVTGDGIVPRTIWSLGPTATIDVIRLDPALGLDLTYYQQLVRDALESPANLGYVRRWNLAPRLYVRSVDEANVPIDQKVIDFVVGVVRDTIPIWTDGKLSLAEVQQGTETRVGMTGWITIIWPNPKEDGVCGRAHVAVQGGLISLNYLNPNCRCNAFGVPGSVIRHEVGHAMGFWHTNRTDDLMFGSVQACDRLPSTRERAVAAIAYKRPFGNINPDADPSSEVVTKVTTRMVP